MKKIDCLAFGPHPDDVELFCSGVLIKSKKQVFTIAVADLTQGELSTNGDVKTRLAESQKAKELLVKARDMADEEGLFRLAEKITHQQGELITRIDHWDEFIKKYYEFIKQD